MNSLVNETVLAKMFCGTYLYVHKGSRIVGKEVIEYGTWEIQITNFISRLIRPKWICLDVGCNIGYYSILMAYLGAKVYAFDPYEKSCRLLQRSIRLNKFQNRIIVINKAVWNKEEKVTLGDTPVEPANKYIIPNDGEIEAISLDSLLEEIEHVDFIKIDVEGSEYKVWQGMQRLVERDNPRILMEVESKHGYSEEFYKDLESRYPLRKCDLETDGLISISGERFRNLEECSMIYFSTRD